MPDYFDEGGMSDDAFEAAAAQRNAERLLTDTAMATGASAANEVRAGRTVEQYGTTWDEVQQRLDEQHPGHGFDSDRARAAFQQIRDQSFNQQVLAPPSQGERDELKQYMQHVPVARHIFNVLDAGEQKQVRDRIQAGTATQQDYAEYQRRLRDERYQFDRGTMQSGLEMMAQIPSFGAEMMLAAPFAEGATAAVGMPLGRGATSLLGRGAQAAPGWLAGAVVGAAAMPANAASSIFQRINPHVGEADATAVDVFKGYLDHQIEIASESLGEPLTAALGGATRGLRGLVSRLPHGPRAAAIANGLTHWATNKLGTEGFQRQLRATGFDGLLGEFLEERAGEVARGATGVEDNYGMTGNLAAGVTGDRRSLMQGLDQLAVEGIGFGGWSAVTGLVGATAANRAEKRLRQQGTSPRVARQMIIDATMAALRDPNAAAAAPAPLRELAQQVADVVHQPAEGPAPGQEAMPQLGQIQQGAEGTQQPGFMRTAPEEQATTAPAENAVPNADIAAQVEQNVTESGQEAPAPAEAPAPIPFETPAQAPAAPVAAQAATSEQVPPSTPEAVATPQPGVPEAVITAADLKGFEHDALKIAAEAVGVSTAGGAAKLRERIAKRPGGEAALAGLPKIQDMLRQVAETNLIESKTPMPAAVAQALFKSKLHASEKAALEGALSGLSFRRIAALRSAEGKPVVAAQKTGKGVTHPTARTYANAAFEKLKAENPGQWDHYPTLTDFVTEMKTEKADKLGQQIAGEPVSKSAVEEVVEMEESLAAEVEQQEVEKNFYREEQERKGKTHGFDKDDILSINESASEKDLNNYRRQRKFGSTARLKGTDEVGAGAARPDGPTAGTQAQARLAAPTQGGVQADTAVRPITPERLKEVADLSPHHAALVKKMQAAILGTTLPSQAKLAFFSAQLDVLGRMQTAHAEAVNRNLKQAKFFETPQALTATIQNDPGMKEALGGGYALGAYDRGNGVLRLDGATARESVARTAGHEYGHVGEGRNEVISKSAGFQAAWAKELKDEQLTKYAAYDAHEGLGEIMGVLLSGEMTTEALWKNYPLVAAELAKFGWVAERSGSAEFEQPGEIFDRPVNAGMQHADTLMRLAVSKEFEAARAHISPRGEQNPTAANNAEAIKANAQALAFEIRQRFDDRLAIAADIVAEVDKKRKRLGLPPVPAGLDLRTVIAGTDPQVKAWAEQMAGRGMFGFDKQANGERVQKTFGKRADWILEGLKYDTEDLKAEGTGTWNDLKRKLNLPVEQGASRLDTILVALHAVHQVERGQAMLDLYTKFITPEQEAIAARLLNTVSTEQLEAFDAYITHEQMNDPKFFAAANESLRRLTQLNDWVLDGLKSVGWYDDKALDRIKRDYPDYISLARVMEFEDFSKGGGAGSEIKPGWERKRQGSELQIISPIKSLQSRYMEASFIMAKQLQFEALLQAGENLEGAYFKKADLVPIVRLTDVREKLTALGINQKYQDDFIAIIGPELIEYMGAPKWNDAGKNFYVGRQNGQRVVLEISSKPLYELMTSSQEPTAIIGGVVKFISAIPGMREIPKLVKWSATTGNLVFPVRNPIRDVWHYAQNAEGTPIEKVGSLVMGIGAAFKAAGQSLAGKEISNVYARLYFQTQGQNLREFGYTSSSEGSKAFRALQGGTARTEQAISTMHKVQEFAELIGASEQGPRIASWTKALKDMGYTEARIEAAMKADPNACPIPLNVMLFARQKAAEVTTDFLRQGIDVREFNRITPFFSPHIAGMSQESRNWGAAVEEWKQGKMGPKSKAMLGVLAMYLGFELLHWWKYKDDPWYKNLPPHLRYDWWVIGQKKDGGTIGVPKPQGILRMVGAFFNESLRKVSDKDARFGMAAQSVVNQGLPRMLPVGVSEAWQVGTNQDWRGAAIVPTQQLRELNSFEQFRQFQLPYVMDQMTGGLASVRLFRGPWEAFTSSRSEPNLPVNDYYARMEELTGAHQRATRTHTPMPPDEAREYARLHAIESQMRLLSREARGDNGRMPTPERLHVIRLTQIRLARQALGLGVP